MYYFNKLYSPFRSNEDWLNFDYHDHTQMTRFLRSVAATHPNTTALYSIGQSGQGNILLGSKSIR